jgi:hypothetical protein
MKLQWMAPFVAGLLFPSFLQGVGPGSPAPRATFGDVLGVNRLPSPDRPPTPFGFLAPCGPNRCPTQGEPYYPQPGDLLLCDELDVFQHGVYFFAKTGPPCHTAMVMSHEDGSLAMLDLNGPTVRRAWVVVFELRQRMCAYTGIIMVRRLRQPISAEQSCALTSFARLQEGKHFATGRVLLQATPFNARYGYRREWFGHTSFDRRRWFCSELVVAGACAAGILDPHAYPANAIYPRDLAFDVGGVDISCQYEPPLLWTPCLGMDAKGPH